MAEKSVREKIVLSKTFVKLLKIAHCKKTTAGLF